MIKNAWYVAQRELKAIFTQPIAYIFVIAFTLISGVIFAILISGLAAPQGIPPNDILRNILGTFSTLVLFGSPALTMRLLSEEQRSGTIEVLMTLPLRDSEVVLGKYIAVMLTYLTAVAFTLIYPIVLFRFGNPDVLVMLTGYLGIILWGSGLLAIGLMASALSEDQINAFLLAFAFILMLYLSSIPSEIIGGLFTSLSSVATFFEEVAYQTHLDNFFLGLLTATDILYYLIITVIALFAATRILESKRWR